MQKLFDKENKDALQDLSFDFLTKIVTHLSMFGGFQFINPHLERMIENPDLVLTERQTSSLVRLVNIMANYNQVEQNENLFKKV